MRRDNRLFEVEIFSDWATKDRTVNCAQQISARRETAGGLPAVRKTPLTRCYGVVLLVFTSVGSVCSSVGPAIKKL